MKRVAILLCGLALTVIPLKSAPAETVYTYSYVGNPFTDVTSPFTTSDFITASFTTNSLLAANSVFGETDIYPTTFSVSDGIDTITNGNPGVDFETITFSTDAVGDITEWDFHIADQTTGNIMTQNFKDSPIFGTEIRDLSIQFPSLAQGEVLNDPGVWSVSETTATTPEPSSIALLGSGALGIIGLMRRRLLV
jgi:hypothetical protein